VRLAALLEAAAVAELAEAVEGRQAVRVETVGGSHGFIVEARLLKSKFTVWLKRKFGGFLEGKGNLRTA